MSVSFARVAGSSTTAAGTNYYSAYSPATATATSGGSLTGQEVSEYYLLTVFTKPYLDAHTLSYPSWRYSYYVWFVLLGLFAAWVILHQLRLKGGFIGAAYRKVGMRKVTVGKKQPGQRSWTSMTVTQLLGLAIFTAGTFVACYVGPDYINPTECMFGGECGYHPVNGDNATDQYSRLKRSLRVVYEAARLAKRRTARYGWSPLTDPLLSGPNFTVDKGYWESSSRIGLIAYALLPLSVGLALKQWPMNPFAAPFFVNLGIDKTAFWHRWVGRMIWVLSTVHTGLWTKQLFVDLNPFNEPTWYTSFAWHRLLAGAVAYGFLTAMVAFSFKPLRNRFYEIFYYSHVALTLGFLVAIIIHYQALQGWCLLAAGLWGLERLIRFSVFLYLNYGPGVPVFGEGKVGKSQFTSRSAQENGFRVHNVEKRLSAEGQKYAVANSGPYANYGKEEWSAASRSTQNLQETLHPVRSNNPVYAYGPGNDDAISGHPHGAMPYGAGPYTPAGQSPTPFMSSPSPSYRSTMQHGSQGPLVRQLHRATAIPRGYALAQILPGKVIKLTLHTPRHLSWKPGQHVMLTTPSVRWWQGHPYSICNAQDMTERMLSTRPAGEDARGSEIVLIMSVRRGFSKHLYQSLLNKRKRLVSGSAAYSTDGGPLPSAASGVLIRAQTYLPDGSAKRARWDDHSTAVIVVAGTGVTFGLSVLEHLCFQMAKKDAAARGEQPSWAQDKGRRKAKPTSTNRVRFVWILREYSHLAWIAPALRRCLDISDPARLRIDLFVTRELTRAIDYAPNPRTPLTASALMAESQDGDVFQPPKPRFARGHARSGSMDSQTSDLSQTVVDDREYARKGSGYEGYYPEQSPQISTTAIQDDAADFSVTDMVLFDGEEDIPTSAADEEVSKVVRKEGKLRRALSRKVSRGNAGSSGRVSKLAVPRRQSKQGLHGEAETSDDEATSGRNTPAQPHSYPRGASHQYPPAMSRSGSAAGLYDDAASNFSASYRRGSTPGMPLLGNEDVSSFDMDDYDRDDLNVIAELARGGKPDLDAILDQEIEKSQGTVIVGCCGPQSLNNLVRGMVAKRISPSRMMKGDPRGNITLIAEDFAY